MFYFLVVVMFTQALGTKEWREVNYFNTKSF